MSTEVIHLVIDVSLGFVSLCTVYFVRRRLMGGKGGFGGPYDVPQLWHPGPMSSLGVPARVQQRMDAASRQLDQMMGALDGLGAGVAQQNASHLQQQNAGYLQGMQNGSPELWRIEYDPLDAMPRYIRQKPQPHEPGKPIAEAAARPSRRIRIPEE